jgi:hypothetical protein
MSKDESMRKEEARRGEKCMAKEEDSKGEYEKGRGKGRVKE